MVTLRDKERCRASRKLLIRASEYDTMWTRTVLPIHKINTAEREMNIQKMVRIINTKGEDDVYRLNAYSSSGIYMTAVKEDQFRIVAKNRRKQDNEKMRYDPIPSKGHPT